MDRSASSAAFEKKLRDLGEKTWNDWWSLLGKDFERGVENIARATGSEPKEVVEFFREVALRKARSPGGWGSRIHWTDGTVLLLGLVIVLLVLRDTGLTPWPVDAANVITDRDVKAGTALRRDELRVARLPVPGDAFGSLNDVAGLVLAKDIARGEPIRPEHVLRAQVVADSNIPGDTEVLQSNVAVSWSPYARGAVVSLAEVVGRRLQRSVRVGEVIASGDIQPAP